MTKSSPAPLTAAAVRAAAARIKDRIVHTPTLPSEALTRLTGANVFVK